MTELIHLYEAARVLDWLMEDVADHDALEVSVLLHYERGKQAALAKAREG